MVGFKSKLFVMVCASLIASPSLAQRVTGVIYGTVRDKTGGVLPGVIVTLNSPQMIQKDATVTTNLRGEYRFPLLDPGTYAMKANLSGFSPATHSGIRIPLGASIAVDLTLELEGVSETVEVSGTPTVDTRSTKLGTNFTSEVLKSIPSGRNLNAVVNFTPGATDGTVHGASVRGNSLQLDGVAVTDPIVGTQLVEFNFDNLAEMSISTGGHQAEFGQVSGAIVNAVTKSGGNSFSGEANFYFQNESLTSDNGEGIKLTPNKVVRRIDTQGQLGGPVIKDNVWFFASYRYLPEKENVVGFPVPTTHDQTMSFGKLSWQMSPASKLIASLNHASRDRDSRGANASTPPESTRNQVTRTWTPNLEFTSNLNSTTSVVVRAAKVNNRLDFLTKNDNPSHFNFDTNRREVSSFADDLNTRKRTSVVGSISHFRDDLGGKHDFKFGFEYEDSDSFRDFGANQGLLYYDVGVTNPTPIYVYTVQDPASKEAINRLSLYAQDTWVVADRVTFNVGVRVDHNKSHFPEQTAADGSTIAAIDDVASYTDVSPRVGIAFDVNGDGRTVARFNYARLTDANIIQYFNSINPNAISGQYRAVCSGPAGSLCLPGEKFSSLVLDEFGASGTTIDPEFAGPLIDEYSVGVEHELFDDVAFSLTYIDKQERRLPEDVQLRDFLARKVIDNGDVLVDARGKELERIPGGTEFTVFSPDLTSPSQFVITNPDSAAREYRALEFVVNKRMSKRWQMLASLVISRSYGQVGTSFNSSTAISGLFNDPNSLINSYGALNFHRPYQLKLTGAYQGPWGLNLSGNWRLASGAPFTRQGRFTSGVDPVTGKAASVSPAATINVEPLGSHRLPLLNELDLRLSKDIQAAGGRFELIVDALNLLNIDTVTEVQVRSRGTIKFGDPLNFHGPREFRLAARYIW